VTNDEILNLIHRWGDEMYRLGVAAKARRADDARELGERAGELMRQIKQALGTATT
jgi:hypothetical protein